MPEVILLHPRVPYPDTDDLLHGEGRTETERLNGMHCVVKKGRIILADRGSRMTNITRTRIGKSNREWFHA